jgi:hypothetical protein
MSTPRDKRLHLAAGALAGAVGCGLTLVLGDAQFAVLNGVVLSMAAGLAKEWYDHRTGRGVVDRFDVLYTAAGGFFSAVLVAVGHAVLTAPGGM